MNAVHRPKGITNLEFFREVIADEGLGDLVDLVSYPRSAYGVIEDSKGRKSAVIFSQWWDPSGAHTNYWYDFRLESERVIFGSPYYHCPQRILDQLDPVADLDLTNEEAEKAIDFRWRCEEYNREQAAKPRPKKGEIVVFEDPYLIDNMPVYAFEFLGKSSFRVAGDKTRRRYRLVSWRRRQFTVGQEADTGSALGDLLGL